jgi:hypothetical protein
MNANARSDNEHRQAMSRERWPLLEAVNMIEVLSYLGTSELAERHVTGEITPLMV